MKGNKIPFIQINVSRETLNERQENKMKRLKELMNGYQTRTFGKYRVEKMLAHWFEDNEDMTEHFCYIYL